MRPALLPLLSCLFAVAACSLPASGTLAGRTQVPATAVSVTQPLPMVPDDLRYFVGAWRVVARDPGTNDVLTITYRVEPAAGGRWLTGEGQSSDLSVRAEDAWGIDPASGDILRFVFDSSGAYGMVRARGWNQDRLVLEGEAHSKGGPTKVRETITRLGPDRFEAIWETLQGETWKVYSIEEATRI